MSETSCSPRVLSALVGMSLTLILSAATVTASAADGGPPSDLKSAPVGVPAPRTVSSWSLLTSEESPPVTASNGQLVSAMRYTGNYCDNVALGYEGGYGGFGLNYSTNYWTPYFSEEGTNSQICPDGFMTGISCRGRYCDDVSLQCMRVFGRRKGFCTWQPWFSEEAQYSYLQDGYYAAGLACRGDYCDDLSIYACQALSGPPQ
jgi:hypothetical protein